MLELRSLGTLDLRGIGDEDATALLRGPKRVALLTYLATATPEGFHRRDSLLAIFWPEFSQRQARSSLRNTIHVLRGFVGPEVLINRGDEELGIAEGSIWCDVLAFRAAIARDDLEMAVQLYRGELLPGFHLAGAPAFENWLSRQRETLHRTAVNAAWELAGRDESAGHPAAAAIRGRFAVSLSPDDEESVCRLIQMLDRIGDRSAAQAAYEQYAERLWLEVEDEPSPRVQAIYQELKRVRAPASPAHPAVSEPEPSPAVVRESGGESDGGAAGSAGEWAETDESMSPSSASAVRPPEHASARRQRRRWMVVGSSLLLLGLAGWAAIRPATVPGDARVILAVGEVTADEGGDEAGYTRMLPDMLSTSLARTEALRVVSTARLHEMRGALGANATLSMAARAAGADELLEGMLVRLSGDRLRLELRRLDLRTGEVRAVHRAEGENPFELVDRVTAELLDAFGVRPLAAGIASVTTTSLLAYRLYEEGVRAYSEGDNRTAQRLLTAALAEDSTFAMASYYRAQSRRTIDHAEFRNDLHRATRLADGASERERLLIRNAWAQAMDEPTQLVLAESLAVRFPSEPEGHLFLGKSRLWGGDFAGALPHLRRVVQMDSLSMRGQTFRCLACDATNDIVSAYLLADSVRAAEREARAWTEAQPGSGRSWHALASTLEYQDRFVEAQVARSQAGLLRSDNPRDPLYPAILALREGDFERADRLLAERDRPGASLVQQNVLWYRVLSFRYQGRHSEALTSARLYRQMVQDAATAGHPPVWATVLEAQVLFEMGRLRESAALWHIMATADYEPDSPSRSARHQAWSLTHAATVAAAAGDARRVAALADSIERFGGLSAYGRDPLLHHHVRGLALALGGDHVAAAASHQRAMFSTTNGYGRINLELGRALLSMGRPREAAEVLSAALRGPLDGANLYVSRAELHEMAAHAWEAAGRPDRAIAHYRWVVTAWRGADQPFTERRESAQRRLARLSL
ncbi:hypothetical protein BH23GEM6_BH23GEM6_18650 [soil metagenome]